MIIKLNSSKIRLYVIKKKFNKLIKFLTYRHNKIKMINKKNQFYKNKISNKF